MHGTYLAISSAYKKRYAGIISMTRQLVAKTRKSSVAIEKLVSFLWQDCCERLGYSLEQYILDGEEIVGGNGSS